MSRFLLSLTLLAVGLSVQAVEPPVIPAETPEAAKQRHERVAERRKGPGIISHRGASEHAHENTLEAFRATFLLGGDGNEFDIRTTRDGVLVVFHDDMLDHLLEAYGDVSDFTWAELQTFQFRDPGKFGDQCRIPTLVEVFDLHRRYAGLMHLDIKRHGQDVAISDLLTRMDMWDHVAFANNDTGGVILKDARFKPQRYKAGLYLDRGEVFPDAIAAALKKPGEHVIVDDPRGVAVALGRKLNRLPNEPVARQEDRVGPLKLLREADLIMVLRSADDWDKPPVTYPGRLISGAHPRLRLRRRRVARHRHVVEGRVRGAGGKSPQAEPAPRLDVPRVRRGHRAPLAHPAPAPNAVEVARFALWRDDEALDPVIDPRWKNPRAWTDFRVKMVIFPALAKCPGAATEKLCRDYLALSDADATKLGPPQFEEAGRALLAVSPKSETALELMKHRLQAVRGRAILDCLSHAKDDWALEALKKGAPHALAYRVE